MKPDTSPQTQTPRVVKLTEGKHAESKGAERGGELRGSSAPDERKEEPSIKPDPVAADPHPTDADLSAVIKDGIVRAARNLFDDQPPPPTRPPWYANPLVGAFVTFILMGLGVAYITYQFNQSLERLKFQHSEALKELELRRVEAMKLLELQRADEQRKAEHAREDQKRESDRMYQEQQKQIEYMRGLQQMREELLYAKRQKDLDYSRQVSQGYVDYARNLSAVTNNTRVQKAGLMLEKMGRSESEIERLLDKITKRPGGTNDYEKQAGINRIDELQTEMADMLEEFRPYLGPRISARIADYLSMTGLYVTERYVNGKSKQELRPLLKRRAEAKPTINEIKNMVLEDELVPAKPSVQPPS